MPKTLIFAKDDAHADEIVQLARDVFGKGNDFAAKITYKSTGRKTDDLIAAFRNSYNPRIAVTVDMIATGTDVKPLECVFFMRSVRSRTYFEQMKGRDVRVINDVDFQAVTPDALAKERFVIVDAVGVTETELVDTQPLDRQPTVPLDKLLRRLSWGVRDPDALSTIAARLSRLDRRLTKDDRDETRGARGWNNPQGNRRSDRGRARPRQATRSSTFGRRSRHSFRRGNRRHRPGAACCRRRAAYTNPELRERIVEVRRSYEQAIDETSGDRGGLLEGRSGSREEDGRIVGAVRGRDLNPRRHDNEPPRHREAR